MADIQTLGVSSVYLREFKSNFLSTNYSLNAGEVCELIIKPRTREAECSFVQFMGVGSDARGVDYVSPANFRVCFSWQSCFADVISLLLDHSEKELKICYYWIDIFCENFHDPEVPELDDAEIWLRQTVASRIVNVGHTLLVLTDLKNPTSLRRSWCVFEIMKTIKKEARLSILSKASDNKQLVYGLVESAGDFDKTFRGFAFKRELLEDSNVPYASVIRLVIRKNGFTLVENMIFDHMKQWITSMFKKECDALLVSKDNKELGYKLATNLANYLTKLGDLQMGKLLLNRALSLGRKLWPNQADFPFKMCNLLRIGIIHRRMNEFEVALNHFEEMMSTYDDLNVARDDLRRTDTMLQQCIIYRLTGKLDYAIESLIYVIKIRTKRLGQDDVSNAEYLVELGNAYFDQDNLESSLREYEEALRILEKAESEPLILLQSEVLSKIAKIHHIRKSFESSLHYNERALLLLISTENPSEKEVAAIQSSLNDAKFKFKIQKARADFAERQLEKAAKRKISRVQKSANSIRLNRNEESAIQAA